MSEDERNIAIAVPGEWALKKAFGPALTEIGEDLRKLYAKGRDKLITVAYRKIHDLNDGKQANLRVTRDVLWNGAFTEDEVCAEYFGGIFAASRSVDGKDDDVIQFVDVIKSLSAKQLRLHYVIYNSLNKLLVAARTPVNVGLDQEIHPKQAWFSSPELVETLSLKIETDLNILHRQGLLHQYRTSAHVVSQGVFLPYTSANPTTFGILLYAVAHNKLEEWRSFDRKDFGDFPDIALPINYAPTLDDLLKKTGLASNKA
jgi:hypothetical protein